jgi:hypothetical protein
MALSKAPLELVIDELVLDGVAPGDLLVRESLVQALGPSLAEHGLSPAAGHVVAEVTNALDHAATGGAEEC